MRGIEKLEIKIFYHFRKFKENKNTGFLINQGDLKNAIHWEEEK